VATGRVLQFDQGRGYGFVAAEDGGEDIFLHASIFDGDPDMLVPGTRVEFEVMAGDRGRKAFAAHLARGESGAVGQQAPSPQGIVTVDEGRAEEQMCDVLSAAEFGQELTELLLMNVSSLTGAQILDVRQNMLELAGKHGWVDG
jgi:cold shock protein